MKPGKPAATRCTMIAAPASRQGKTVLTAALARTLANRGESVQVIKLGPDYLDPMILERASGRPVTNLDWWIMGEAHCRRILYDAAGANDVVLIESLMGVHDNTPSSARLARTLGVPVTLVMNMAKYAQTAAAVLHGLLGYAEGFPLAGVVGNRLGSSHHHTLVSEAIPEGITYFGSLHRDERMALPERHLGLVQGGEITDLDARLDAAAQCLADYGIDITLPEIVAEEPETPAIPNALAGKRIAVAKDNAFGFVYPANVQTLQALGAEVHFFSPLADEPVPDCDALWLPGGYPELHLSTLEANTITRDSVRAHCGASKPTLAECGGMMYLGEAITGPDGSTARMCGVVDASFTMHDRFQSVGHQQASINDQTIRGHAFHHSSMQTSIQPSGYCVRQDETRGEALFTTNTTVFTYAHLYFPSNPSLTAELFAPASHRNRRSNRTIEA